MITHQGAELLLWGGKYKQRVPISFPTWGPEWSVLPGVKGQGEDSCIREGWVWVTVQLVASDPIKPTGKMP